ncbi:MAG: hypothetical protein JXB38_15085 [Anaerolineales bacterium]|nr:hypothetical protein [Anaerolineales bacterium]
MATDQVSQLVSLLTKTGAAHRDYIENIEKVDVDYRWPVWYAAYLLDHDLEEILGVEIDRTSLAGFIAEMDGVYKESSSEESWQEYYAQKLLFELPQWVK